MGFAHPRSSGHTLETGGLFFLRMETGAGPSMRNSEKGVWKPSREEARVVSRGEDRVNRATEPRLEGSGLCCQEEEEKESSQLQEVSRVSDGPSSFSPWQGCSHQLEKVTMSSVTDLGRALGPPVAHSWLMVPIWLQIPL